ncbi:hypothetical protein RP20_CCG025854 [Aedes albopictus]|nr:hypothetical protein RP20_CCG025854 [Aedes albopictus]
MDAKALKTTKEITSRIDSGVPKKPSMITLIHSRQPSTISRTSSRQSGLNIVDRRPSNTSANRQRPATSFVSTRVSHPSNPNIGGNDKLQLSVHQLGKLPAYLRNRRPATASESVTSHKPKEEPFQFLASYTTFQQNKEPPEAPVDDSGIEIGSPPCEGQVAGDAGAQGEEVPLGQDLKEVLEKSRHLAAVCDRKQERIVQLEAELAAQGKIIQERDEDIQKMNTSMNKVRSLSNSRDTIAREGMLELEQKFEGLQQELTQRCGELNKCKEKCSKLKQKLTESKALVEERDKTLFELLEKDSERKTELDTVKQQQQELKLQLTTLRDELAAKDALISELRAHDPIKIAQSELDGYRSEVESLQKEVKELRFENQMLVSVKKQDDVILQIRTKLLENLERNNEAFRIQCERICGGPDEGDGELTMLRDKLTDIIESNEKKGSWTITAYWRKGITDKADERRVC